MLCKLEVKTTGCPLAFHPFTKLDPADAGLGKYLSGRGAHSESSVVAGTVGKTSSLRAV